MSDVWVALGTLRITNADPAVQRWREELERAGLVAEFTPSHIDETHTDFRLEGDSAGIDAWIADLVEHLPGCLISSKRRNIVGPGMPPLEAEIDE
jgi:hypothetical protein